MTQNFNPGGLTFLALVLSTLACRPVITVGWLELALIGGLILLLAAPLLIRAARFLVRMDDRRGTGKDESGEPPRG